MNKAKLLYDALDASDPGDCLKNWEEEFLVAIGTIFDEDECEWKTREGVLYDSIMELIDGENLYSEFYPYLLHYCKVSEIDPDKLIKEVK